MTGVCTYNGCTESLSPDHGFPYCREHAERMRQRTKRQERPARWVGS